MSFSQRQKILKCLWSKSFELQNCGHTEKSNCRLNLSFILIFLTIYGAGKSQCDRSKALLTYKGVQANVSPHQYKCYFKLATPFESKTLNIRCIKFKAATVTSSSNLINIINCHCHKLSDAILNGQPKTARSTQTSCGELREFIWGRRERKPESRVGREEGRKKLFFMWQQAAD